MASKPPVSPSTPRGAHGHGDARASSPLDHLSIARFDGNGKTLATSNAGDPPPLPPVFLTPTQREGPPPRALPSLPSPLPCTAPSPSRIRVPPPQHIPPPQRCSTPQRSRSMMSPSPRRADPCSTLPSPVQPVGIPLTIESPRAQHTADTLGTLAARNAYLEAELTRMKQELSAVRGEAHHREQGLMRDLDEMKSHLGVLEHQVAVAEGRCHGLLEAARKEWTAEATLGGRAEATKLATALLEVQASQMLLAEREKEMQRLMAECSSNDAKYIRIQAQHAAELSKAEGKNTALEAQVVQLVEALEAMQSMVRTTSEAKEEMKKQLDAVSSGTITRDDEVARLQNELEILREREALRDRQLSKDRQLLSEELKAAGASSIEELKLAKEEEQKRYEKLLAEGVKREQELLDALAACQTDVVMANNQISKLQVDLDNEKGKMRSLQQVLEKEREKHKRDLEEKDKHIEEKRKELERQWQMYGRVQTTDKEEKHIVEKPSRIPSLRS